MTQWDELVQLYEKAMAAGDPRVRDWPVMNPFVCLGLIAVYLVTIFGLVKFMKNREPFKLKEFAFLHNVNLTLLSLYMCVGIVREAIRNGYTLFGNSLDRTENGMEMARLIWIFYLSKILEFFDTVIMALKKNNHQISFLHVYHHTSIFFIWWIITYYAPGGESYFSAALNSFIHVLMYGYYLWATLAGKPKEEIDPKTGKPRRPTPCQPAYYRPWITRSQMIQFSIMFCQAVSDIIFPAKDYPVFAAHILFYYMMTMLALFGNFYIQAYFKGGKKGAKGDKGAAAPAKTD